MEPILLRVLVVAGVIALAALAGRRRRSRDGEVRDGRGRFTTDQLAEVGLDPRDTGACAILLGSPTCAPCVTVGRVLDEVADRRPDLRWVYVDAADHLELAAAHRVMRVPTLFVVAPTGRILARTSGVPTAADLLAVLDREERPAATAA